MTHPTLKHTLLASAAAALLLANPLAQAHNQVAANTATTTTMPAGTTSTTTTTVPRSERMKHWTHGKEALEKALGTGKDKAAYRSQLEQLGYWITAVNVDSANRLELEVVKGEHSYEVQIDLANNLGSKVDVTSNVWRAESTRKAMSSKDYRYTYPTAVTTDADKVRDSVRSKTFVDEKGRLEALLPVGHDAAHYKRMLEKQGYKVTSVNENNKRNLEYEIVKGDTSYEVQIDLDEKTGKSTRVGVSANLWETAATERAKRSGS